MQRAVLDRLRNRPPAYQTRHNYNFQQREHTSQIAQLPVNQPPPPYESGGNSDESHTPCIELPPQYTIESNLNLPFTIESNLSTNETETKESFEKLPKINHI